MTTKFLQVIGVLAVGGLLAGACSDSGGGPTGTAGTTGSAGTTGRGGTTGTGQSFDGSNPNGGPFTFNQITSHDFKLGVRWMIEPPVQNQPMLLPPLMRRG